jgi:hypothetical protein
LIKVRSIYLAPTNKNVASFRDGEIFCKIRSCSILKKNDMPVLQGLRDALVGRAYGWMLNGCR